MKKVEIMNTVTKTFNNVSFKLKKHSPEILVVAGVVGVVASAVMACKATTKVSEILEEAKGTVDVIHEGMETGKIDGKEYPNPEETGKKDLTLVYVQTGLKLAKLYAPAVGLGVLSITSILTSNNILRKRNVALAAAYATVDKTFKQYRNRVVERFGEEVDRQLRYNIKAKEIEETVVDENGNEQTVKTVKNYVDPTDISGYARYFEQYTRDENGNVIRNHYWDPNKEYNLLFLKAQQSYANDLLKAKKRLFLNEVYEILGLPKSKAGQIVGWVYDEECPMGDNYVDFGLYASNQNYSDFVYSDNEAILLDFNVDGNIWEDM